MNVLRKSSLWVLGLIILAYIVYASIYIYESSFMVEGQRYFVLFDDAMISMRYARNLAHGYGLVWNPGGARVEGFTNPLWVFYMAIFHLFPIDITKISLALQISGAVFFIASLFFVKKIAKELIPGAVAPLLAVFLTAFYSQLSTWSLLGMEVSVLILITCIAAWKSLRLLRSQNADPFSPWLYVLLGVSTLVRIDMAVVFLSILIFMTVADAKNRRKHLIWGISLFLAFIVGQTLLRLWYYGEPLPNTYYLKVTGAPFFLILKRGLFVFVKFLWNFNLPLFLLPFAVILLKPNKSTLFLSFVFFGMCAYSIYVGGDAWESKGGANRFISTVIPLFFVLFAYSLELIRLALIDRFDQHRPHIQWLSVAGLAAFAFVGLVNFNALLDTSSLKFWLLLERHPFIPGSERYVDISVVLNQITTPEASVAVVTAGIIPYFAERPSIDLLGKSDPVIAREPMHLSDDLPLIDLRPGHMKWDYAYSIAGLKPDVVAQIYDGYNNPENLKYLTDYTKVEINGLPFFLRNGSPNILWGSIPEN